jgi:hypothetical protein
MSALAGGAETFCSMTVLRLMTLSGLRCFWTQSCVFGPFGLRRPPSLPLVNPVSSADDRTPPHSEEQTWPASEDDLPPSFHRTSPVTPV